MSKNTKPIGKLYESAVDITATINIEPSTEVDLNEGDVLTADLFTDEDDEELVNLISIADVVAVEEVIGRNAYKVNATINDDVAAISLYQWIYANTNIKNDEDLEEYVAPGLVAVVNAEEGGDVNDDPDATADYEELAAEMDADGDADGETYNESVSSKFAKYRKLYESAINEEDEKLNEKDDKGDDSAESNDDWSDIFGDESGDGDDKGGDDKDDKGSDDKDDKDDDKDSDESGDETEDVPMTAVVLTVGKDDADKCKDEMIEAGIAEDDIEIIDGEDEENSKIKVDVNSVKELKDYLKGKGIDLEEKIGGEIVDDEEGDDNKDDDKEGDDKEDDKDGKESGDDDIENMDFGDLFGDDDESSDEGK